MKWIDFGQNKLFTSFQINSFHALVWASSFFLCYVKLYLLKRHMTPGGQSVNQSINLYLSILTLSKLSRSRPYSCVNILINTYLQFVYALTIRSLFHIKMVREVQLQLQVILYRQGVLTVGILCIRSRPGGAGYVTCFQPWQILSTTHCVEAKRSQST